MLYRFGRVAVFGWIAITSATAVPAATLPPVDFNRDIKPLLSDRCFSCHGPDQGKRVGKMRLDTEDGARPKLAELVKRVTSDDTAKRMPPAWSGAAKLSPREIDVLTRWVAEGGQWKKHWSFIPPERQPLPLKADSFIDAWVLDRLNREGLKPSPEADKRTLIRRVSFDLTGLPPKPAEVNDFLHDGSPAAYEKVVDRLLASPAYGERMAERWLDAARYADTNGYQTDGERYMWRWRDYVIDAFNRNTPYDRFTIDQLAGDLLPNPTFEQVLATGFNRNHRGNGEGGIIPEEYAVEYVVDRADTTSTVWMGLTLGCARCHDHKYDPFKQREFYQLFAYFNNVPERGKAFKYGNSPPVIPAPTVAQQAELATFDRKLAQAEKRLADVQPSLAKAQPDWERGLAKTPDTDWAPSGRSLAVYLPLKGDMRGEIHPDPPRAEQYRDLMANGPVEVQKPAPGRIEPVQRDGFVEVGDVANFGFYDSFTFSAWIQPTAAAGTIISRGKDEFEGQGISLCLHDGHLQANLVQRWLDDGGRIESEETVQLNRRSHVMLTYDGTRVADGIRLYLDGKPLKVKVQLDDLNQSFDTKQPLRIGAGLGKRFQGAITDVRVYRTALTPDNAALLAVAETPRQIANLPAGRRTPEQSEKLRRCYLSGNPAVEEVDRLRAQRQAMVNSFPTSMVMRDNPVPRETHILLRGAYDHPGDKVVPGVPAVLPAMRKGAPNNRLGLAQWIVDPSNPLTARVAVNRFWQMYFGTGLVKTVEDFGSQGEVPSHPELLDWLAIEFVQNGWNVKALQKTIVMSATYRQSSKITPELLQRDPENRLLARGPRLRLPAEMVRDQALAISGLLVSKIGGPSVKPYQPPGLWKELSGGEDYRPDTGEGLHRRSLYTFWKRTSPPPMMMNVDSSAREACTVREAKTNTPLQSLNLMNDPTFLEASRALAQRVMAEGGSTPEQRIAYAFELATSRGPKQRELDILVSSYRYYLDTLQTELAAYSTVASLILNLDETVTKQ